MILWENFLRDQLSLSRIRAPRVRSLHLILLTGRATRSQAMHRRLMLVRMGHGLLEPHLRVDRMCHPPIVAA